jgi:hypothetical protein
MCIRVYMAGFYRVMLTVSLDASTYERLPVGTPEWLKVSSPVAE